MEDLKNEFENKLELILSTGTDANAIKNITYEYTVKVLNLLNQKIYDVGNYHGPENEAVDEVIETIENYIK